MRDIGEQMRRSRNRAPSQPFGRAGWTTGENEPVSLIQDKVSHRLRQWSIALLRVVADDPRRLPPRASLLTTGIADWRTLSWISLILTLRSWSILPARLHGSCAPGC